MRKGLMLAVLVLLVSCATPDEPGFSGEEAASALAVLSADMLSSIETASPRPESFKAALPYAYSTYSEYVPLYSEISSEYAASLADITSDLLPVVLPVIEDAASALIEGTPEDYILGDTSFSEGLREECYERVIVHYTLSLMDREASLASAFERSQIIFSEVRLAYQNLSSVGRTVDIPQAYPMDKATIAGVLADELFYYLGEAESSIKNSPLTEDNPVYSIFWGT